MCTHGGGVSIVTHSNDTDFHQWTRKRFIENRRRVSCCERPQAARDFWVVHCWVEGGTATAQGPPWRPAPCRPRPRRRGALGPRALAWRYQRTVEGVYSLLPRGAAQSCKYDNNEAAAQTQELVPCCAQVARSVRGGFRCRCGWKIFGWRIPPASDWRRWFFVPSNLLLWSRLWLGGATLLARA